MSFFFFFYCTIYKKNRKIAFTLWKKNVIGAVRKFVHSYFQCTFSSFSWCCIYKFCYQNFLPSARTHFCIASPTLPRDFLMNLFQWSLAAIWYLHVPFRSGFFSSWSLPFKKACFLSFVFSYQKLLFNYGFLICFLKVSLLFNLANHFKNYHADTFLFPILLVFIKNYFRICVDKSYF